VSLIHSETKTAARKSKFNSDSFKSTVYDHLVSLLRSLIPFHSTAIATLKHSCQTCFELPGRKGCVLSRALSSSELITLSPVTNFSAHLAVPPSRQTTLLALGKTSWLAMSLLRTICCVTISAACTPTAQCVNCHRIYDENRRNL